MTKKQTFGDKVRRGQEEHAKSVKIVFTYTSPKNGQIKFSEKILKVYSGDNEAQRNNQEITNGRAILEGRA